MVTSGKPIYTFHIAYIADAYGLFLGNYDLDIQLNQSICQAGVLLN